MFGIFQAVIDSYEQPEETMSRHGNDKMIGDHPRRGGTVLMVFCVLMLVVGLVGIGGGLWIYQKQQLGDHALKRLYFEFCVQQYQVYRGKDDKARADKTCKDIWDGALAASVDSGIAVNPFVMVRVVAIESEFQCDAVSPVGAFGCAQVMIAAHGLEPFGCSVIEQRCNIYSGARILADELRRFNNDLRLALLAYNRGPSIVTALLRQGIDPANGYAAKVMRI